MIDDGIATLRKSVPLRGKLSHVGAAGDGYASENCSGARAAADDVITEERRNLPGRQPQTGGG